MLFEHVKKRITKGLLEEVKSLSDVELELVGHRVIETLEGRPMVHHGLNKDYKPSGYTVDTFSQDSLVVGEYSTEKGYFENIGKKGALPKFPKIENDISHAISHKKPDGPEKIYLISNEEEPPSFRQLFNQIVYAKAHGTKLAIYDARELAKHIYEQSAQNATAAAFYRDFFPEFGQNLDNYEYYGKVPSQSEHYCPNEAVLNALDQHFGSGQSICVLYGLSGSGKTQAAIEFIHSRAKRFNNYVWIDGNDWGPATPLSSIQRSRGGVPINVAGMFNSAKTLLVIDDLDRELDANSLTELQRGCANGGVVLVTSQINMPGNPTYLPMPALSRDAALQVLGVDPGNVTEDCENFVQACRFSPLILATTRKISELEGIGKDDLYREVLTMPNEIAQGDGTSIMKRILSRLDGSYREALTRIADSGSSTHDSTFLTYFIGASARVNLQRLAFLKPARAPGLLAVHDLICRAVQTKPDGMLVVDAIEAYIDRSKGEMVPSVLRQIHLCVDQLVTADRRRGKRDPDWITYSLLQVEGHSRGGAEEALHGGTIVASTRLAEAMCIVDAKEAYSYTIADNASRKSYYEECAEEYRKALLSCTDPDVRGELLHHRGKALRRSGRYKDALACFKELLDQRPDWHATFGQIAHLGSHNDADEDVKNQGKEALLALIERMFVDASAVPLRVSLAAIARLRPYRDVSRDLVAQVDRVQKLADIIAMSALEGLGQFFEAYVAFTSIFSYRHSAICVEIAERVPEMLATPPDLVESSQWERACEALTNTAIAAARAGKDSLQKQIAEAAVQFASRIDEAGITTAYVARVVAKAYITADLPGTANEVISKVPSERVDHWILYLKSKAEGALGQRQDAVTTAKMALELVQKDAKAKNYVSTYHDQLSKCYGEIGDVQQALKEAESALALCQDEQYAKALTERVQLLKDAKGESERARMRPNV